MVVCGRCTVSSVEEHLTGFVGGIDGMILWVWVARDVRSSLVGLGEVGPSG